jgi:hypothetical protein
MRQRAGFYTVEAATKLVQGNQKILMKLFSKSNNNIFDFVIGLLVY